MSPGCAVGQCTGEITHHLLRPDNTIYLSYCEKHWQKVGKARENESCLGVSKLEYETHYQTGGALAESAGARQGPALAVPAETDNGAAKPSERRLSDSVATRLRNKNPKGEDRQLAVVTHKETAVVPVFPQDLDSRELAPLRWDLAGSQRFTPEQEAILRQPANPDLVEIKYDGTVYAPGAVFRKILNDAFGPGGWYLALEGQPQKEDNKYYLPAVLVAEGRPVSRTVGEYVVNQKWDKPGQGTIWESCCTDSITKCCKTLGVYEELWFPAWVRKFKRDYCHFVKTAEHPKGEWRRKDDLAGADQIKPGYSSESEYERPRDYVDDARDHLDAIQEEA